MSKKHEVIVETTAQETIEQVIDHLALYSDCRHDPEPYAAAFERIEAIIDKARKKLSDGLVSYKVCPMLLELGETRYHELIESGYRFIYRRFDDSNTISIYVVIHEKQDIKRLLIEYCLIKL